MIQTDILQKLNKILAVVKRYKKRMAHMSDEELAAQTGIFKKRIQKGESLNSLLPEVYATVCEADLRILGMYPFDVQIMGAIALHQGYLAQMNTGEGKTLVATMPLYLNALTGRSTILVTTNEYLALRDAEEMGKVYRFLGLTVAAGVTRDKDRHFTNDEKKRIYRSDIVYTTNGVLGFDYLFNNLVTSANERFMRPFYYAILDEADSVLLDTAQTPLVISGSPKVQSNLYEMSDFFVSTLKEGRDYERDDERVWFTDEGITRAETFFGISNFYGSDATEINRHVMLALRAHALFHMEKDYVVSNQGELVLLDAASGRLMPGVKMRGGQHQAIEVKEKLELTQENRSVASVTYQNLFRMFPKLAGMSGTIADASAELGDIYGLEVVVIPTNRPLLRKDYPDRYFLKAEEQMHAAMKEVVHLHETGQPVLIVVSTIAETETVSDVLLSKRIPHNVLNANNAFWEADMIREAGKKGAVTVATSMAGRGTDIKLEEGVAELGGLAVIGIGRMANIRQERQARGRAGRQGDPGFSRFYVSLEDEIVQRNTESGYLKKHQNVSISKARRIIKRAQEQAEETAVFSRKQAFEYDFVLQKQRSIIYEMRNRLLDGGRIGKNTILGIAKKAIDDFLENESFCNALHLSESQRRLNMQILTRYVLDHISYSAGEEIQKLRTFKKKEIRSCLLGMVISGLYRKEENLDRENRNDFYRVAILRSIDDAWVDQVDYLNQLQQAVTGRATAQKNPIFEYQTEAMESFEKMKKMVYQSILRNILLSSVSIDEKSGVKILYP